MSVSSLGTIVLSYNSSWVFKFKKYFIHKGLSNFGTTQMKNNLLIGTKRWYQWLIVGSIFDRLSTLNVYHVVFKFFFLQTRIKVLIYDYNFLRLYHHRYIKKNWSLNIFNFTINCIVFSVFHDFLKHWLRVFYFENWNSFY